MCAIGNSIHSQNCQECARFNMSAMSPVRTPVPHPLPPSKSTLLAGVSLAKATQ